MHDPLIRISKSQFARCQEFNLDLGGTLLDALQIHFPSGFSTPTRVKIDGRKIPVDDAGLMSEASFLREIKSGQIIEVNQSPGIPGLGAALATWLIVTIITTAATYLLNALFGTKPTNPVAFPEESPVYSISGVANRSRPGEPVAEIFGEVISVPDLGAQPYFTFQGNEQFYIFMAVIGVGNYSIIQELIDDTPITDLTDASAVVVTTFPPATHLETFGVIETTTGLYENVVTSIEVGDQELLFGDETLITAQMQVVAPNKLIIIGTEVFPEEYKAGETVIISGLGSQDGSFTIQTILDNRKEMRFIEQTLDIPVVENLGSLLANRTGQWSIIDPETGSTTDGGPWIKTTTDPRTFLTVGNAYNMVGTDFFNNPYDETITVFSIVKISSTEWQVSMRGPFKTIKQGTSPDFFSIPTAINTIEMRIAGAAGVIGPFIANLSSTTARLIEIDIIFPQGIYVVKSNGSLTTDDVDLEFTIQEIDNDGVPVGGSQIETETISEATNTPQRRTFTYTVTSGRYRVSAIRTNAESAKAQDQSRAVWAGLKAVLEAPGNPVYGNTTIQMWKIRATNGIANAAQRRARTRCQRKLTQRAGTIAEAVTRNPSDAWYYIASLAGVAIDTTAVQAAFDRWDNNIAEFNGVFDTRRTLGQSLSAVLAPVLSTTLPLGGEITIIREELQPIRAALFTSENISPGSLEIAYDFDDTGANDGVEVEYREPDTFAQAYEIFPAISINPERVTGFGITDSTVASAFAEIRWNRRLYQRKGAQFVTSPEGHISSLGSKIGIAHMLIGGGDTGMIISTAPDTLGVSLFTDRRLSWAVGETNFVILRNVNGDVSDQIVATRGTPPDDNSDEIIIAALPGGFEIAVAGTPQPTIFVFGTEDMRDFLLTEIQDAGDDKVEISAIVYDARVYDRLNDLIGPEPT